MAKACSAGRMERCTCDEAPDLENRKAWQWGGCGDNLKYSNKFVKDFLGKRSNKDLRARVDMHNTNVGMKVSTGHFFGCYLAKVLHDRNRTIWIRLSNLFNSYDLITRHTYSSTLNCMNYDMRQITEGIGSLLIVTLNSKAYNSILFRQFHNHIDSFQTAVLVRS